MGPALLAAGVVVALLLLGLLVVVARSHAETRRRLERAQSETAALRERLEVLSARLERPEPEVAAAYVITDAGTEHPGSTQPTVPDRLVLSAAVGEPLVKALALGHGVRRALSAESRNRIRFEVRREVRRSRKSRRREMKDAWRREQAEHRSRRASAA